MHFLALLLGESLEPPRDVDGDGYADFIVERWHRTDTSYAPATVAYLDAIHGVRS